jgi:hypothetical protein
MTDSRDPFAGSLAAPQQPRPEDATERRIPFTPDDERRIEGVALWTKIVGIVTLCSAGLTGLINLVRIIFTPFNLLGTISYVVSFIFTLLLGLFLLQASSPLHKLAVTDEADKQYLIEGCQGLTKYFNLFGVFMVFTVALLTVMVVIVVMYVMRLSG